MKDNISGIRKDYAQSSLDEASVLADPIEQFKAWFDVALASKQGEPNAMTLATVGPNGQPSLRIVLIKGIDPEGFSFYTNYESKKGQELAQNPKAALNFYWPHLERQVRIEGLIEKLPPQNSDAYFASRPKGSRIGAHASPQSQVIPNRHVLSDAVSQLNEQYNETEDVPRPPHWGGYRLRPNLIEFWQGRPSRLHDRLQYRMEKGKWIIERLAP